MENILSIIIVNWNTKGPLLRCLESVFRYIKGIPFDVTLVDNGSWDGSLPAVIEKYPTVKIIANDSNLGFARANNQAITSTSGKYCLLLNSDTEITEQTCEKMLEFMEHNPSVGIIGAKLLNMDGTMQNSFDNIPTLTTELLNKSMLRSFFPQKYPSKRTLIIAPFEVESIIGACMLIRRKALEEVGLFDEDFFVFLEETDLCYRMKKAGWKVIYLPQAQVYHLQGSSKAIDPGKAWIEYYRSLYIFFKKNRGSLAYITLRVLKVVKIFLNLFFTTTGMLFTLGMNQRIRRKFIIYSKLLLWHLLLCPAHKGLKEFNRNR